MKRIKFSKILGLFFAVLFIFSCGGDGKGTDIGRAVGDDSSITNLPKGFKRLVYYYPGPVIPYRIHFHDDICGVRHIRVLEAKDGSWSMEVVKTEREDIDRFFRRCSEEMTQVISLDDEKKEAISVLIDKALSIPIDKWFKCRSDDGEDDRGRRLPENRFERVERKHCFGKDQCVREFGPKMCIAGHEMREVLDEIDKLLLEIASEFNTDE